MCILHSGLCLFYPDVKLQAAGKRIYMLYQLKRAGVNQADLVTIYISVVRPVVEYACPVWHTNLPIYLSDNIEMIQKRAVKAIFPGMSYVDILNHINLTTFKERRDYLCKKYFINMQARSYKVNCLLPEKGMLTRICDVVICTHYLLLEQIYTGIR